MSHRIRALALASGILLATAGAAQAAPTLSPVTAAPASTAAGTHSDFTVSFTVNDIGSDDVKTLRIDLPPGLVGNPQATKGTCSHAQFLADSCPASTKVGTTSVVADVTVLVLPVTLTIPGDVYNIATTGGEAARLGIVLRPSLLGLIAQPKQFLESPAVLRSTDGGLTSVVENIPRTASTSVGTEDLTIRQQSLTLLGKTSGGGAFETNPTSCAPAKTTVTIGTYAGATASGAGSFTPTNCDALPFAPRVAGTVGQTRDDVRVGGHPKTVVTVTQAVGEANAETVQVALPRGLGADARTLPNACPVANYAAGTCAANAVVGSARAESPLLAAPLTGPVTYVAPGTGLPQLRVALRGPISVDLVGNITFADGGRLVNTFDGIFDVPLTRFVLTVDAGPNSPILVSRDLCEPGYGALDGTFTAHSGKVATAAADATLPGCDQVRAPKVTARLGELGTGHPVLKLHATSADRPLSGLKLTLPSGLTLARGAAKKIGRSVSGTKVAARGRALTLTLPAAGGASALDVTLRKGALTVSKALRRAKNPHLKLTVQVLREGLTPKRLTVKPKLVARP